MEDNEIVKQFILAFIIAIIVTIIVVITYSVASEEFIEKLERLFKYA